MTTWIKLLSVEHFNYFDTPSLFCWWGDPVRWEIAVLLISRSLLLDFACLDLDDTIRMEEIIYWKGPNPQIKTARGAANSAVGRQERCGRK